MTRRPTLAPIGQPPATLRDMVQDRMRMAIIEGLFKPGERLVERPLCDQLGVSRTVVRETIRYLEAEGLVEAIPGKGPIVARMNRRDARQIYDIRRMLETAAAETCANVITPPDADRLAMAFERLRAQVGSGNSSALFQATSEFYSEIFTIAGHSIAWEIVDRLNGRISRLRMMTLSASDRDTPGIVHMQRIRDAITSGDAAAARIAVEAHLNDAAMIADRLLASEESQT